MKKFYWWLRGVLLCYDAYDYPHIGLAFCKRRKHHLGKHKGSSKGYSW